jgi:hypothetical protein
VAVVDAVVAFVRCWLDEAILAAPLLDPLPTRASVATPQAYGAYREARAARERPCLRSAAPFVSAAAVVSLAAPFLLPVLERPWASGANRPAAAAVASVLAHALALRHDKVGAWDGTPKYMQLLQATEHRAHWEVMGI